jgi:lipid A 3-O-deacylase
MARYTAMTKYPFLFVFLVLVFPLALHGQTGAWSIRVDNDILNLLNQTDRYYTSGIHGLIYHDQLNKSPLNVLLVGDKKSGTQLTGISIRQGIYTPGNIYANELLVGDRPYASYLMIGQQRITTNQNRTYRIKSELSVGVLGKYSGGQALQNFIHSLTPYSANANGWHNQIQQDLALNYRVELEKGLINNSWFQMNAIGKLNAGTLRNRADIGMGLHTGYFERYFLSPLLNSGKKQFSARLFADVNVAYVAYDATLQGGVFNGEQGYVIAANQVQNWRLNYRFGLQLSYKQINLEVGRIWETREFANASDHGWGYIQLQFLIP